MLECEKHEGSFCHAWQTCEKAKIKKDKNTYNYIKNFKA